MTKEKQTYGETVDAGAYTEELQFHQYIPQADAVIFDEIRKCALAKEAPIRVLDLGMGPGRLTPRMAQIPGSVVVGLDNSPSFVEAAKKHPNSSNVQYECANFLTYEPEEKFDVIFMQGVWHHVSLEQREAWLQKMHSVLSENGRVIVGDEYIPEYENQDERVHRVGLFYLHIIGEAVKIQNFGLARNECLNFLADTLHDEETRGCFDSSLLAYIQEQAVAVNDKLFTTDKDKRLSGDGVALRMIEIMSAVRRRSKEIAASGNGEWIDRGDYKESPKAVQAAFSEYFMQINRRDSGPVNEIGGMSVLTFESVRS